jgi:hypothetical protein
MPTGIMRGRFHPVDGQLYVCGLFGWSSDKTQPGGLYRVRRTGKPLNVPIALHAREHSLVITFSDALDRSSATNRRNYSAGRWNYRPTAQYGSEDYRVSNRRRRGRDRVRIAGVTLAVDNKTVTLEIPDMSPAMQMEIKYRIKSADGKELRQLVHHTIHNLGPEAHVGD